MKYIHGVANPRIEDGSRTELDIQQIKFCRHAFRYSAPLVWNNLP